MDAEGARELTRRIGSTAGVAPRPVPANLSAGALSLYRWFGGDEATPATEPVEAAKPAKPVKSPSLRRLHPRGS